MIESCYHHKESAALASLPKGQIIGNIPVHAWKGSLNS